MTYNLYNSVKAVLQTEKTSVLFSMNKLVFKVANEANKKALKEFFEKNLGLEVKTIRVLNMKPKSVSFKGVKGKRAGYKKAIITFVSAVNFNKVLESL